MGGSGESSATTIGAKSWKDSSESVQLDDSDLGLAPASGGKVKKDEEKPDSRPGAAGWYVTLICSSISMTCLNKLVATGFKDHFALLSLQACMTVGLNFWGAKLGVFPALRPFSRQQFFKFFLCSISFTLMLATSLTALPQVSVPTVVVFRAFSIIGSALLDKLLFGNQITRQMAGGLFIVVLGAGMYSMYDITYNRVGYMWLALNMTTVLSTQFTEKHVVSTMNDQSSEGMAIIQNTYLMIIAAGMSAYASEDPIASFRKAELGTIVGIFMTGIVGFVLNLCSIQLNRVAPATSIALAGWFSKLSSILIGPILFQNQVSFQQMLGAYTSIMGIAVYSDRVLSELRKRPLASAIVGCCMLSGAAIITSAPPIETLPGILV